MYPYLYQRGMSHGDEHPIGQREKTRARGQLWAGEDSKVRQSPGLFHQMEGTMLRPLKAQTDLLGGQGGRALLSQMKV